MWVFLPESWGIFIVLNLLMIFWWWSNTEIFIPITPPCCVQWSSIIDILYELEYYSSCHSYFVLVEKHTSLDTAVWKSLYQPGSSGSLIKLLSEVYMRALAHCLQRRSACNTACRTACDTAPPAKSKVDTRGPKNWSLERGYWTLPSTFPK